MTRRQELRALAVGAGIFAAGLACIWLTGCAGFINFLR